MQRLGREFARNSGHCRSAIEDHRLAIFDQRCCEPRDVVFFAAEPRAFDGVVEGAAGLHLYRDRSAVDAFECACLLQEIEIAAHARLGCVEFVTERFQRQEVSRLEHLPDSQLPFRRFHRYLLRIALSTDSETDFTSFSNCASVSSTFWFSRTAAVKSPPAQSQS